MSNLVGLELFNAVKDSFCLPTFHSTVVLETANLSEDFYYKKDFVIGDEEACVLANCAYDANMFRLLSENQKKAIIEAVKTVKDIIKQQKLAKNNIKNLYDRLT